MKALADGGFAQNSNLVMAKSISDGFFLFISVLLSPTLISRSVSSFVLRISINHMGKWAYPFIRFIRDKKVWLCFPQNRHPQISQIPTASLWPTMSWFKGCPAGKVEEVIYALVM